MKSPFTSAAIGLSNPLDGFYLMRGYHKNSNPYTTVSELPFEQAVAMCENKEPNRGISDERIDGSRDQTDYMKRRLETEENLRESARKSGVKLDRAHPIYFAFLRTTELFDEYNHEHRPNNIVLKIPAVTLDLSNWSFTLRDHFFDNGTPRVYNGEEFLQLLPTLNETKLRSIEAQFWGHTPQLKSEPIISVAMASENGFTSNRPT